MRGGCCLRRLVGHRNNHAHSAKLDVSALEVAGGGRRVLGAGGGSTASAQHIASSNISAQKCQPSSNTHSTSSLDVILRSLFGNQPFGCTCCRLLIARTMREPRRKRSASLARCGTVKSGKGCPAANARAAASMVVWSASDCSKTPLHHVMSISGSRSMAL